jgi:hypothetical protein
VRKLFIIGPTPPGRGKKGGNLVPPYITSTPIDSNPARLLIHTYMCVTMSYTVVYHLSSKRYIDIDVDVDMDSDRRGATIIIITNHSSVFLQEM